MNDSQEGKQGSHLVQVIVAVIGLIGILGGALFANWDKVYPTSPTVGEVNSRDAYDDLLRARSPPNIRENDPNESCDGSEDERIKCFASWGLAPEEVPFNGIDNATSDVGRAFAAAKEQNKILMVEFGANWCPDCLILQKRLTSPDVKPYLDKHFIRVTVDVGNFNKNLQVALDLGVDLNKGIPIAAFFDSFGKPIGHTNKGELEPARKYSSAQILGFLTKIAVKREIDSPANFVEVN